MRSINSSAMVFGLLLAAVLSGCAAGSDRPPDPASGPADSLMRSHLAAARRLEKTGELTASFTRYKLAQTIVPESREAVAGTIRMEKRLRKNAERHYRQGLSLMKRKASGPARRAFLSALKDWPEHTGARQMLTGKSVKTEAGLIVHVIRPGETLSKLAQRYYRDYKKYPIIARFNALSDPTRIAPGQIIRIPEIDGVSLDALGEQKDPGARPRIDLDEKDKGEAPHTSTGTAESADASGFSEGNEGQAEHYRQLGAALIKEKRYREAIAEFKKAQGASPGDAAVNHSLYLAHFQLGSLQYGRGDFLGAKALFDTALAYDSECKACSEQIAKSLDAYLGKHYKLGVTHYRGEKLEEAIRQWRLVHEIDPNYRDVGAKLKKAGTLLERLERIRKMQGKNS